ncbi:MAG: hypothetical protein HY681_05475 [Chloroflexi bacterium]|nr:hypothetical protein [Chloroflexota bacterium]
MTTPRAHTSGTVEIEYAKSPAYRVIHVDGAWGGATGQRNIRMGVYSEGPKAPDRAIVQITEGEEAGKETQPVGGPIRVAREIEADLVMSLPVAKAVLSWLQSTIENLEEVLRDAGEASGQP